MTSALIPVHGAKGVHPLVADLEAAGIQVLGIAGDRHKLVQEGVRHAPDLVICDDAQPGDALFKVTLAIAQTAPSPVMVFTNAADADLMARASASGVHAYVVNGLLLALDRGAARPLSVPSNTPLLQRNPTAALKLALGLSLVFNLMRTYAKPPQRRCSSLPYVRTVCVGVPSWDNFA